MNPQTAEIDDVAAVVSITWIREGATVRPRGDAVGRPVTWELMAASIGVLIATFKDFPGIPPELIEAAEHLDGLIAKHTGRISGGLQ